MARVSSVEQLFETNTSISELRVARIDSMHLPTYPERLYVGIKNEIFAVILFGVLNHDYGSIQEVFVIQFRRGI